MKTFTVAVSKLPGKSGFKKSHYMAYTMWYSPEWSGINTVEVQAKNGTEAKKEAIDIVLKATNSQRAKKIKRLLDDHPA